MGRSDGPLPRQTQHWADHTRPKSMWSRVTKCCAAFMRPIEQYIALLVNCLPGYRTVAVPLSNTVDTGWRWTPTIDGSC
ncbi:hypothetical protein SHIRM173S_13127 [Streptomyces hirsutus]